MLSYKDFTIYFSSFLTDKNFQSFLAKTFNDLTAYNVSISKYISSASTGIELGFANNDAVYDDDTEVVFETGNPIFSHFNLWPKSQIIITDFPFDIRFDESRNEIINKIGQPTRTNEGYADFLNKSFLVDNYKIDDLIITFDYDPTEETINFIQFRDNNLVEDHLKL
jgi:hypothetical protein